MVKNYNLNVTEVHVSDFKMLFPEFSILPSGSYFTLFLPFSEIVQNWSLIQPCKIGHIFFLVKSWWIDFLVLFHNNFFIIFLKLNFEFSITKLLHNLGKFKSSFFIWDPDEFFVRPFGLKIRVTVSDCSKWAPWKIKGQNLLQLNIWPKFCQIFTWDGDKLTWMQCRYDKSNKKYIFGFGACYIMVHLKIK